MKLERNFKVISQDKMAFEKVNRIII